MANSSTRSNFTAFVPDVGRDSELWARGYKAFKWIGDIRVSPGDTHLHVCLRLSRLNRTWETCLPQYDLERQRTACKTPLRSPGRRRGYGSSHARTSADSIRCSRVREEIDEVCVVVAPSTLSWSVDPNARSCGGFSSPSYKAEKTSRVVHLVVRSALDPWIAGRTSPPMMHSEELARGYSLVFIGIFISFPGYLRVIDLFRSCRDDRDTFFDE